jgi:hypothetical protein
VQEILGVGQTVGTDRAQIGQLEMVVAVPVGGRRIGERGIRYHKRRERNEREQKKRTEKEKKDKKEKQKNCVNACAHVSLSLSWTKGCMLGPVPHPLFSWCQLANLQFQNVPAKWFVVVDQINGKTHASHDDTNFRGFNNHDPKFRGHSHGALLRHN